jgi:hypothetical protein
MPPSDPSIPYNASSWQQLVDQAPGVLTTELTNVSALLTAKNFPEIPKLQLTAKKLNLHRFIEQDYCKKIGCQPASQIPHWEMDAKPIPNALRDLTTITFNTTIFAFGGIQGSSMNDKVSLVLDTKEQQWSQFSPPLSGTRYGAGSNTIKDLVYTFGGLNSAGTAQATGAIFMPKVQKWKNMHPMKTARASFVSEAVNGKIYVMGGSDGSAQLSAVEAYNKDLDSWGDKSPMTQATDYAASAVLPTNQQIWIFGGRLADGTATDAVVIYDTKTDAWADSNTSIPASSTPRFGHTVDYAFGKFFIIGGTDGTNVLGSVISYNVKIKEWTNEAPIYGATWAASSVALQISEHEIEIHHFGGCMDLACTPLLLSNRHNRFLVTLLRASPRYYGAVLIAPPSPPVSTNYCPSVQGVTERQSLGQSTISAARNRLPQFWL